MSNETVPTALHATLFLARMLAREGDFPVQYLDGFQRLIDDVVDSASSGEYSSAQIADIRQAVLQIISEARGKADLE